MKFLNLRNTNSIVLLTMSLMFFFFFLMAVLFRESREIIFILLITNFFTIPSTIFVFKYKRHLFTLLAYIFTLVITFPSLWILGNGIDGTAPFVFPVLFLIPILLFRKRKRDFLLVLSLILILALIILEHLRPELIYKCVSHECTVLNKLTGLLISTTGIVFLSYTFFTKLQQKEEYSTKYAYYIRKENVKLQELANTDPLTNLPNRRNIEEKIRYQYRVSKRKKFKFAFMMIDIDDFKKINDQYGHLAGDYILKEIARIIKINIRDQDTPSRWGGEEFLVLLPDCDVRKCTVIAERIKDTVEKYTFKYKKMLIKLTVSIGVSEHDFKYSNSKKYIEKADRAMYISKAKGKNRVTVVV